MEKTINLEAAVEKTPQIMDALEEMLQAADCPRPVIMQILLSLEEIYVNVANYAYGKEKGNCTLVYRTENGRVEIDIYDAGIPFNPLSREDPDITLKAMDRPIGGLGILITKKIMDEVRYEYTEGQNHMHLVKNWSNQ